jgi:flagellar basal body-associated protein FliL
MNQVKRKMLLAPILAIVLAFLLAGVLSFLPQNASQGPPTPQPTSYANPSTPPLPTSPPVAQTTPLNGNFVSILFAVAAVVVGIVAACLLFSERSLKKEISE